MTNIMMTTEELRELKRLCSDPLLEFGMTLRPKHVQCFKLKVVTHSITTIILFENYEDAKKWNTLHEDSIRNGGHAVTLALSGLMGAITGNFWPTFILGAAQGIIKDELQARIWYPEMEEGWMLTRHHNFVL